MAKRKNKNQRFLAVFRPTLPQGILVLCLLAFLFIQAETIFALELNYPPVPGATSPQEIAKKPSSERLPLFLNYFIRLFFLLTIGVAVTATLYGGALFLLSGAKPAAKVEAINRIKQGLLGLTISASVYLILYTINPQLLNLKNAPSATPSSSFTPASASRQITYLQIPYGTNFEETLASLNEIVSTPDGKLYRVEIPFQEASTSLEKTINLLSQINDALQNCQCGQSRYQIKFEGVKGKCASGDPSVCANKETPEDQKDCEQSCSFFCTDCGTKGGCPEAIARITEKLEDGKCPTSPNSCLRENLLKALAEMETLKIKFSTEQISFIEKNLNSNIANFLSANLLNIKSQGDFVAEKTDWQALGYDVVLEKPEQFSSPGVVRINNAPTLDPFSFYAVFDGPPEAVNPKIAEENQETYRWSQRASIFSVLTQLSLEDIQTIIQDCLSSAFGQGQFIFDIEEFAETIEAGMQNWLADFLGDAVSENGEELAATFTKELRNGIDESITDSTTEQVEKCKNDCDKKDEKCLSKCQEHISPHFLSDQLAEFFTVPLKDHLPKELSKALNEKVRSFFLGKKLNKLLDSELIELLDKVFQGALSKSLEEQIPFLKKNLEKRMFEILPLEILKPLQQIDVFLTKHLKNIKERIDKEISKIADQMGQAILNGIAQGFTNFRKENPDLFLNREDCTVDGQYSGYYWDDSQQLCQKATPDQINDWDNFKHHFMDNFTQEGMCHRAGYCWDKSGQKCEECQWVNLKGLSPNQENLRRLGKEFLKGLVNFAEAFMVALAKTAIYTMTRYAQVWVEDEILGPLQPYLEDLGVFQQTLHKFLTSTIKDLLPASIANYLSSNIDEILKDLCSRANRPGGGQIPLYRGMSGISVSQQTAEKACSLDETLHTSLLDQLKKECDPQISDLDEQSLGCQIVTVLDGTISQALKNAFCQKSPNKKCFLDALDKSFAEILWPDITNIKALIQGTPKQFFCGQLKLKETEKSLSEECASFKSDFLSGGLLPYYKPQPGWMLEEEDESKKVACYFIWYACEPLSGLNQTLGKAISQFLKNNCQNQTGNIACQILTENSLAFTLFDFILSQIYGSPPSSQPDEEIEADQWLYVTFPQLQLRNEIDKVVQKRQLWGKWTSGNPSPRQEAKNAHKLNDLPLYRQKGKTFAQAFVSWLTQGKKVYDIFTDPSFGEMAYLKDDPNYRGKNFLARTPYLFLTEDICGKIKNDFQKNHPDWTFEAIWQEMNKLAPAYSLESLNRPTVAKVLDKILMAKELPRPEREAYVTCLLVDKTPAEVIGLDQKLVRYLYPKEYQILFDLINDKLDHNTQMPAGLKNLLETYLYGQTPIDLLASLGEARRKGNQNDELGNDMVALANFLRTRLSQQINQNDMAEQIIVLIFKWLFPACPKNLHSSDCPLYQTITDTEKWGKLQDLLALKPVDLIEKLLPQKISSSIAERSLMDMLADGPDKKEGTPDDTLLGQPYLDTLGRALHLDQPIANIFLAKEKFDEKVNKAIIKTKEKSQDFFDTVFIEKPTAILKQISSTVAGFLGIKLGGKIADRLVGACRQANAASDCRSDEVFNQNTKECCATGQGLVCVPRCREKPADEDCLTNQGETQVGNQCCFDEKCRLCREPKTTDNHFECKRKGEEVKTTKTNEKLCCKERIAQNDSCCVNVMDCIFDKLSFYLETVLAENFVNGPLLNPSKEKEKTPPATCPADLSQVCSLPGKLAECENVPATPQRSPELQKLLDCIAEKTNHPLPEEGGSNAFYGSLFTYDHDYPLCNFTRGQPICSSKCSHTKFSCHYGGKTGANGTQAVDFGNEANFEAIKKAAADCGVPADHILNEGDHLHISTPSCDGT